MTLPASEQKPIQSPVGNTAPVDNQAKAKNNNHRNNILWLMGLGIVILGLAWICLWFFYLQFHQTTDDAYTNGNQVVINATIPGNVIAFFADDTDLVTEGELLVQLDRTDYQTRYDKELRGLAAVALQVRQLYDTVQASQAAVKNKQTVLTKAKYDYTNRSELVGSKAVSDEDFIHAKNDLLIAELELEQANAQLLIAQDAVGNTSIEKHPLIEQQKAVIRTAYYNLQHCNIYAPTTGYVAQRSVEVGQWVMSNTALMTVIPTESMWVDANFKETQLTHMRIGQPTTVWFDLYGSDVVFEGKVLGIASGTGSIFSLIPPQNATGNWIKIVQRLPVRISLDPRKFKQYPPRLGISANVDVDISNRDLPILANTTSRKPIATTHIYTLSFEEVDKTMEEVIQGNLLAH